MSIGAYCTIRYLPEMEQFGVVIVRKFDPGVQVRRKVIRCWTTNSFPYRQVSRPIRFVDFG